MSHIKARLLAVFIIIVFAGLTYIGWHQLTTEGKYPMKIAAFGPVGIVGGLFLLAFPTRAGKPKTAADKILVMVVFIAGLAAGLLNWYLMDPGFFGR
jgi:hypothetical protein